MKFLSDLENRSFMKKKLYSKHMAYFCVSTSKKRKLCLKKWIEKLLIKGTDLNWHQLYGKIVLVLEKLGSSRLISDR